MIGRESFLRLYLEIQNSLAPPGGGRVAHQTDRALEGRLVGVPEDLINDR